MQYIHRHFSVERGTWREEVLTTQEISKRWARIDRYVSNLLT